MQELIIARWYAFILCDIEQRYQPDPINVYKQYRILTSSTFANNKMPLTLQQSLKYCGKKRFHVSFIHNLYICFQCLTVRHQTHQEVLIRFEDMVLEAAFIEQNTNNAVRQTDNGIIHIECLTAP
jgi:hypothetical protein